MIDSGDYDPKDRRYLGELMLEEDDPLTKLLASLHGHILAIAAVVDKARTCSLEMDLDSLLRHVTDCSKNVGIARDMVREERGRLR
jgi:hypothetical protein